MERSNQLRPIYLSSKDTVQDSLCVRLAYCWCLPLVQIEVFPYSVFYIFFEQYLNIMTTTIVSLLLALGKRLDFFRSIVGTKCLWDSCHRYRLWAIFTLRPKAMTMKLWWPLKLIHRPYHVKLKLKFMWSCAFQCTVKTCVTSTPPIAI
jgi:hypothetical protein